MERHLTRARVSLITGGVTAQGFVLVGLLLREQHTYHKKKLIALIREGFIKHGIISLCCAVTIFNSVASITDKMELQESL
jgi:hypothetical protein